MLKLNFVFDAKKELYYIKYFESNFDKLNLPHKLRYAINTNNDDVAIDLINSKYKHNKIKIYETGWRKIEKRYFDTIEKITGHKWFDETYTVYLTTYMIGFCDPIKSKVTEFTVRQNYSDIERNYIIAHELFHSHYFNIAEKFKSDVLFETELNENADILTLCFTEVKNILLNKKDEWIIKGFIESNKKSAPHFKKLLEIWKKRKSFDDYLEKSVNVLTKN